MDILYAIGQGSKWGNNEIRFSLRSIEKYGQNVGRVYAVGYDPGILSENVTFIPYPAYYDAKQKNILDAIVYAVSHSDIGEDFLYSSDDHFYIKDTDFHNYPYFCKGELRQKLDKGDKARKYHISLIDTRKMLQGAGYSTFDFSQHGNTHFTREGIEKAMPLIKRAMTETRYGVEPTCIVLNTIYSAIAPFEITNRKDVKIKHYEGGRNLQKRLKGRECFSIYDDCINEGMGEYLRRKFPDKSKYEI